MERTGRQLDSGRSSATLPFELESEPMDDRPDLLRNPARHSAPTETDSSDPVRVVLAIIGLLGAAAVMAMNIAD